MAIYALGEAVPNVDPAAYVHPDAVVIGEVTIGPESSIWPGAVLRGDHGEIRIGTRTSIQDGTVIHTTERWPTIVGDECVVGHLVHLEGCTVADRVLVGSGSIMLNRSSAATRSVIGAALGVPARVRPMPEPGVIDGWIDYAVEFYCGNAVRFAKELRRLD
jgi:carbonic anhydrase/acetyltransferase-like protein (isoleucine patch superfamily)